MELRVKTRQREYPIIVGSGKLRAADQYFGRAGRIFVISDSGVPGKWIRLLADALDTDEIYIFSQGEANKSMRSYEDILTWLAERKASRKDMIAAIGGGVTGDMAGFAAATYMRGINYVNIPTTTLSMIDSGIGGKTAIDLSGLKNIVGAFWQPSAVIIDTDTLTTLPERHIRNGLAEAVKSGLIGDPELFRIFEGDDYMDHIDEVIMRSIEVKKRIVEEDENETSLRKVLNLGHTFGHAYESLFKGRYLHGECVAMGMMTIIRSDEIRGRLKDVLVRLGLPYECGLDDVEDIVRLVMSDKKVSGSSIDIAQVDRIGEAHIETWGIEDIENCLRQRLVRTAG